MKTVTAENEIRARKLLDQGYLAGRVAEMVGISIAAVDRINGSTPEPDRTRYGQPLDVKHATRKEHADLRPAALRKETAAVVTPTPPPVAPRPVPERPNGGFIPPLYDYQLSAKIGEPPPATVELQCLALDHAWTWTVTPGHPPTTCTEHRGYKALTCDGCGETFYYERKGGTVALYCSPACRARKTRAPRSATVTPPHEPAKETPMPDDTPAAPLVIPVGHKALRRRIEANYAELAALIAKPPTEGDPYGFSEKRWTSLQIRRQQAIRSCTETLELLLECMPEGDA